MGKIFRKIKSFIKARIYWIFGNYNKSIRYYETFFKDVRDVESASLANFFDKEIENMSDILIKKSGFQFKELSESQGAKNKDILIISSELYDTGGHTELALRFIQSFKEDYNVHFLLTGLHGADNFSTPKKQETIKQEAFSYYEVPNSVNYEEKFFLLCEYIKNNNFSTIIVNIHMFDVVAAMLLCAVKKGTGINILFINHADHFFSLATNFADYIFTRLEKGKPLLKYLSQHGNLKDFLFLERTNEKSCYSSQQIVEEKQRLKIPEDSFITLTGAPDYKIFSDKSQPYLKLIKKLLDKNSKMVHVIIGASYEKNKAMIDKIIGENLVKQNRIIFLEPTPDFDFYICLSDLYIDSFPQGSALTLLDCSRNFIPTVVKVNKKYPTKSFQMYMPKDYEYACENTEEMFDKIIRLMTDKNEYDKISKEVREHYIKTYSIQAVKQKYMELIK